jgi:hypothetical protein
VAERALEDSKARIGLSADEENFARLVSGKRKTGPRLRKKV